MAKAKITMNDDFVQFNTSEAVHLGVEPGVKMSNPFSSSGEGLFKTVSGLHEYKMMHLSVPSNVLQPQSACATWNPSSKSYMKDDKITCIYYEVNESLCPSEYLSRCLHNISSKGQRVEDVMVAANSEIEPITAALIVGLQDAIAADSYKIGFFADPNFGSSEYHSADHVNLYHEKTTADRARMIKMMSQGEGIDTILRRRTGNDEVSFVNTNNGSVSGNAMGNIKDFLVQVRLKSKSVLKYWNQLSNGGGVAGYYLQGGLYRAYIDYLETLNGGSDNHRFIVDGTPVRGVYEFEGDPVIHWVEADLFDEECGLIDPDTGHSKNQRCLYTAPEVLTLLTNLESPEGFEEAGLIIQRSPDVKDKGEINMFMNLGLSAGVAHNKLVTYCFNTSTEYNY